MSVLHNARQRSENRLNLEQPITHDIASSCFARGAIMGNNNGRSLVIDVPS